MHVYRIFPCQADLSQAKVRDLATSLGVVDFLASNFDVKYHYIPYFVSLLLLLMNPLTSGNSDTTCA